MPPAEPAPQPTSTKAKARLLLVDDHRDLSTMLALLLRRVGYEVTVANDGPSAIQAAIQCPPDAILLDIGMPVMDGHEVAREIRRHPQLSRTTLIAMTGYGEDDDLERARESGFNDYLLKPVSLQALEDKLGSLDRPSTA